MSTKSPTEQIDSIIEQYGGWKGELIKRLRTIITDVDANISEEIKWKMATRPEGLPVWMHNGIVCYIETWNDNIKLIFFKGAELADPTKIFNARLNSKSVRAIEFHDGNSVDEARIKDLVIEAIKLNNVQR